MKDASSPNLSGACSEFGYLFLQGINFFDVGFSHGFACEGRASHPHPPPRTRSVLWLNDSGHPDRALSFAQP
jgi:hypothetical protein